MSETRPVHTDHRTVTARIQQSITALRALNASWTPCRRCDAVRATVLGGDHLPLCTSCARYLGGLSPLERRRAHLAAATR